MKDQRQRDDFLLAPWIESGELARVSEDGKTLIRLTADGKRQSWTLPEGATAMRYQTRVPLSEAGGEKFFMLSVSLQDGAKATAVCRLDGTTRLEWRGNAAPVFAIQRDESGRLWSSASAARKSTVVFVLTGDGRFLPPLSADEKSVTEWLGHPARPEDRRVEALHVKGTRLFLRIGFRYLAEIDGETGKCLKVWAPPQINLQAVNHAGGNYDGKVEPNDAGFHYIAGGRIYHAGFDGVTKDLGPARME